MLDLPPNTIQNGDEYHPVERRAKAADAVSTNVNASRRRELSRCL
jgi:hypothetical protein